MGHRVEPLKVVAHWRLQLIDERGRVKAERRFENLITNAGLDAAKAHLFDSAADPWNYVAIGTSATPEDPTDTVLGTETAREAGSYTAGGVGVATVDATFGAGVGTGAITECGLFDDATTGTLFNHKTFAAINKGAGDTLKVTCTITLAGV